MAPKPQVPANLELQLPLQIVSPVDVGRLTRELQTLEDYLYQVNVRAPGTTVKLPPTSSLLTELSVINKLNLLQTADRQKAKTFLTDLKEHGPVLFMSFASDPSPIFMRQLITWLRANIHPQVMVRIGLQPTIAAGCIVRGNNHQWDFSLRHHFDNSKALLLDKLHKLEAPANGH